MATTLYTLSIQLTVVVAATLAVNPGMISRITPRGFDFLRKVGVQKIEDMIQQYHIPPQSGKSHGINYKLWNMKVIGFKIPKSHIRAVSGAKLVIEASYIAMTMSGNFEVDFIRKHSGIIDVCLEDLSLSFAILIRADRGGRPSVRGDISSCRVDASQVSVNLHGHKFLSKKVADAIHSYLNNDACGKIVDAINNQLEQYLVKLTMVARIYEGLELDYSLMSNPMVNSSIFDMEHKGEVFAIGHHSEAPDPIPIIQMDSDHSRMFYVWISDYVINSAGYVLHNIGYLRYNVTQADIPPDTKVSLNTSQFPISTFFPQVRRRFPDVMMEFHVQSTKQPIVKTTAEKVTITVDGEFAAYVTEPNNTMTYLFTLGSQLNASFSVAMKTENITWVSKFEGTDLKLLKSAIGDINIDMLKTLLPLAINKYAIPQLNNMGAIGRAIPSFQNYQPTAAFITQGQSFLKVGTDLRLDSPMKKAFSKLLRLFISQ